MHDPYAAIARFYDRAVRDRSDLALYEALAGRFGGPVLEVGAGTGRIAIPLALAGHEVVALDRSPAMIAIGRAAAVEQNARVAWVEGTLETHAPAGPFRLILFALDTFLHLTTSEGQRSALGLLRRLLAADGCLALDLPTLASWSDWQPGIRPLELVWTEPQADGGTLASFTSFACDPVEQIRHVTHIFEEIAADGATRRWVSSYPLRFVGRFELELMLGKAGFTIIGLYGDYELGTLQPDSERLIALARPALTAKEA